MDEYEVKEIQERMRIMEELASDIHWFADIIIESDEDREDFNNCIKHVGKYDLYYEVFTIARQNLDPNPTKQECLNAIGHQMDEWDL